MEAGRHCGWMVGRGSEELRRGSETEALVHRSGRQSRENTNCRGLLLIVLLLLDSSGPTHFVTPLAAAAVSVHLVLL